MTMTLTPPLPTSDPDPTKGGDKIQSQWQTRLANELSEYPANTRSSILWWLVGEDLDWEDLTPERLQIVDRGMDYRFRILSQRYLGQTSSRAYQQLMQRLGGLVVLRDRIRAWVAQSRDCQQTVVDVLQEVIQEMLQRDRYIRSQIVWIDQCTKNPRLRDALLFATIEEYCLRPIRDRPLIAYRFVNYLRHIQTGGITSIPQGDLVKLVSEEIFDNDSDSTLSLLDRQAQEDYRQQQVSEETQICRHRVKEEFRAYLVDRLGEIAGVWLDLYLQGKTPIEIASALQIDVAQIYRLREKIQYHAIKGFALKAQPELVSQWLQISLLEHNLGLTSSQWDEFCQQLSPRQLDILTNIKAGNSIESIARILQLRPSLVKNEWIHISTTAKSMRNDEYSIAN